MKPIRSAAFSAVALATLSMFSLSAHAHPILEATDPASDKAAGPTPAHGTTPKAIRLTFSEGVMAKFCGVELKDKDGSTIATGRASTDPADAKLLLVPLSVPLVAGRYTVSWHAVSEDTHRVKGEYTFTIAP